ncbi:MAG: conjugal transfer protein TraX [Clostridia bacterium]|nr:conjugal transfer protein TraX [Clostridia bacterium]
METQKQLPDSTREKRWSGVINADVLKLIAVVTMIIDHIWQAGLVEARWFNWIGRLAFPIFAFQIAEGYVKTSNVKRYALRLLAFALISEIPFNIFCADWVFFPDYQNVIFTLFMGLCAIIAIDKVKKDPSPQNVFLWSLVAIIIVILAELLSVDYGAAGVMTVLTFYLFRDFKYARIFQFLSMILIFVLVFPGNTFVVKLFGNVHFLPVQLFAVFSLIPIWLYNGEKGLRSKALQYGFYIIYPLHLLVIYGVKALCF